MFQVSMSAAVLSVSADHFIVSCFMCTYTSGPYEMRYRVCVFLTLLALHFDHIHNTYSANDHVNVQNANTVFLHVSHVTVTNVLCVAQKDFVNAICPKTSMLQPQTSHSTADLGRISRQQTT
jgi:hypothetical protein